MKFTGERCILGEEGEVLKEQHLSRYKFTAEYITKNKINNEKILDLGCGIGYGTNLLAQIANEVIGVDISCEAIDSAKKNYSGKNIKFYLGDATNLNFLKDSVFDVIISFEVIEHISNYHQLLKEACRLLKSSGIFIISTPNKKYSSPNSEKPINPFHTIEFNLNDFKELLATYFDNIKLYGQHPELRFKDLLKRLIPLRLRRVIFSQKIRDAYALRSASKFTNKNIENCTFFIAICKK